MNQPIRDYDGLIAALRARKQELGLSDIELEDLAGLTRGHVSKVLPAARVRNMGPLTIRLLLQSLGLYLVAVGDPEQERIIRLRVSKRDERRVRKRGRASAGAHRKSARINKRNARQMQALWAFKFAEQQAKIWGRMGGKAYRKKVPIRDRRRFARIAAKARWSKHGQPNPTPRRP